MAQFQKTTPRDDTVPRRGLTEDDVAFLDGLQSELNTQDTMGNRDPRFWVIKQTEEALASEDRYDRMVAVDGSDGTTYDTLDEFIEDLTENDCFVSAKQPDGTWLLAFPQADGSQSEHTVSDIMDAVDVLSQEGYDRFRTAYVEDRGVVVADTLFLTHRECEDHLRRYGYNYKKDAHAFAMTAIRSPQFERLIGLLQSVDWKSVVASDGKEARDDTENQG